MPKNLIVDRKPVDLFISNNASISIFDAIRPPIGHERPPLPVYALWELKSLIDQLATNIADSSSETHTISYLIDTDYTIWFSKQSFGGQPIDSENVHLEQCIITGNIHLSSDFKKIIAIDHCNKYYLPMFDNIKLVLAIFLAYEHAPDVTVKLAEKFTLDELVMVDNIDRGNAYVLHLSDVKAWINIGLDQSLLRLLHRQQTVIKQVPDPIPPTTEPRHSTEHKKYALPGLLNLGLYKSANSSPTANSARHFAETFRITIDESEMKPESTTALRSPSSTKL